MNEKLKSFLLNDQLFYGIIVILVALVSFGLGRASVTEKEQNQAENVAFVETAPTTAPPTSIASKKTTPPTPVVTTPALATAGSLVGSKSGTKYHLTSCPGAKQIKEENKVYFASVVEAEAAGYKPAANCPQLQ